MKRINKFILALLFVFSAMQVYSHSNAIECPIVALANDISTSGTEFKTLIKSPEIFKAWNLLNKETPTLRTNIEELKLVSKNLDEINSVGGYLKWKQKTAEIIHWANLENELTAKLSSTIESSTLTKMLSQMKNGGKDGLRLALRIEKGTYENIDGYIQLIKSSSVDQHLVKSVNQALDKADDLIANGINKSLLQFEDNPLGYDIDLGIKISIGSSSYSEAFQFKTNTAPLTKNSIADASKQLYTAPTNKRIVEFRLSEADNISAIKNNESIIKELKFQLYEKGLKPSNNVIIDEFHLISTNGEKVKVIYNGNNIQFINI